MLRTEGQLLHEVQLQVGHQVAFQMDFLGLDHAAQGLNRIQIAVEHRYIQRRQGYRSALLERNLLVKGLGKDRLPVQPQRAESQVTERDRLLRNYGQVDGDLDMRLIDFSNADFLYLKGADGGCLPWR